MLHTSSCACAFVVVSIYIDSILALLLVFRKLVADRPMQFLPIRTHAADSAAVPVGVKRVDQESAAIPRPHEMGNVFLNSLII